jgi:hypothetical protein
MPEPVAAAPVDAEAQEFARAALVEVADAWSVGPFVRVVDEADGVASYLFECHLPGYPGWKWTVTVARVDGAEPTVVESQLMPGDGSLLAPDWLPWSERLEEWRAAQEAEGAGDGADDDDESDDDESDDDDGSDDDESDDDDGSDEDDPDDDGSDDDDPDAEDGVDEDDIGGSSDDAYDGIDLDALADDDSDDEGIRSTT